jgi:hypothetical protein
MRTFWLPATAYALSALAALVTGEAAAESGTGEGAATAASAPSAPMVAPAPSPCPREMARVGATCVDRWEAHLVVADALGGATRWPHYQLPPAPNVRYEARSAAGITPQGLVSRHEAERACRNAGKRLCTLREWRRACQGSARAKYPYGADEVPGRCNSDKKHLPTLLFGEDRQIWDFRSPQLLREPGFLAPAGAYAECVSEDGIHDMVGNLHEWVSDTVTRSLVVELGGEPFHRHRQGYRLGNGVFAGGFFSTHSEHGPGCYYTTIAHYAGYSDYSIGFRCCRDAPGAAPAPAAAPEPEPKEPGARRSRGH